MFIGLLIATIIVVLAFFAADRHLCLKDIEKDLKEYYKDLLVARDCSEGTTQIHYIASVSAVKTLIRKHFKL